MCDKSTPLSLSSCVRAPGRHGQGSHLWRVLMRRKDSGRGRRTILEPHHNRETIPAIQQKGFDVETSSLARSLPVWEPVLFTGGLPCGTSGKTPPANAGDVRDVGSIPELERSPGERHGNPLQYSCLEHPMDQRA